MSSVLGLRGQLVIEKPIRDELGLGPGHVSVQRVVDDHVEIRFFPPEHDRSLRGILAPHIHRTLPPEQWDEARAAAWVQASGEVPTRDDDER